MSNIQVFQQRIRSTLGVPVPSVAAGRSGMIRIREEQQINPVSDEVLALVAVVQPILLGVLYSLKGEVVRELGGYDSISLKMLARVHKPGDGDCGICFEYAVHDAMNRGDQQVLDRVNEAIKICKLGGTETRSILFAAEKTGSLQLIDTANNILTDESRLLTGIQAQPVKLRRYLERIVAAFKNPKTKNGLPYSISGLWKADLFVGRSDSDRWVGTTVKSNPAHLEGAQGLRVGIIPARSSNTDKVRLDETKNLVICPLLHDGNFMQTFYEGWQIVQAFIASGAEEPSEVMLPTPQHRHVARMLRDRRDFPVLEVVEAIKPFAQPELILTSEREVGTKTLGVGIAATDMMVAPLAKKELL
jgi:hypothetical protein